ncbi:MAG: response regulator [Salinivirgaceae bacterium]|nr:response regulator [Salinivirgaceae bacterium]
MKQYDFSGKKILIAEDEYTNFLYLKALLKKTNAEVVWVKTGSEAVEAVRQQSDINLVLMDMLMPEMDGKQASVLIKELRPNVVIIAQTAFALNGEREEILACGCDDYVSKPISGTDLLERIEGFLIKQK